MRINADWTGFMSSSLAMTTRSACEFRQGGAQIKSDLLHIGTGLRRVETEIGKWRAETDARKPPTRDQKPQNCRPETRAHQPNRRNVGGSPTPGTHDAETALAGWGARIRTWEWRNQNPLHLSRLTRRVGNRRLRGG